MATILIVDDRSATRTFLVRLLRGQGHQLLEASDGLGALASVRSESPDLVITDVLMPRMDGHEFVRQLREDPQTRGIPIVLYTPRFGQREASSLASGGAAFVMTKPAEPEEILKVVRLALSGATEIPGPAEASAATASFDREQLRLVSDALTEKSGDLRVANARLRALINVGLELASERDLERLLHRVCTAARDLFGATYVTLGIVDLGDGSVQRFATCGVEDEGWFSTGDPVAGVLRKVIDERRTLRGEHRGVESDPALFPSRHPEVQSFLAAPVASPTQVYGWFCLVGNEGRAFSQDDEDQVTALSGQLGRIYETGHFYAIAQQRARELEHEILERGKVEAELRREHDHSQRCLDTAQVILLALDKAGTITLVNRHACQVLGWDAADLIGRDWITTCLPARVRQASRSKLALLADGGLPREENVVLTKAGEERRIEWRNTVLHDDEGRVIGSFSSGTDLTERNTAIEARRTGEARTQFALQNAGVGIWDMDYESGTNLWSPTLEAQYGLAPGAFGGTFEAFMALVHPDDRGFVRKVLGDAAISGQDFSLQHRVVRPDGTVRWLNGAGRVGLGSRGEPLRAVGISMDVTDRHMLEEQYQQAQKMEAIGRLAGGIAHDFNNLLTAILGYCELLLADCDLGDPRRADIGAIQKAGESAAGLTRQLLAFSRKQIIEPTILDLNSIVNALKPMLGRLIGEDVKVVLALRTGLGLIKTDRGQVEQIVLNLAVNARDAMPHGGTLTIETANIEIDVRHPGPHPGMKPGPYVALTVSDTGTGMTPAVQARLFEPFFTTKDVGKGTGLGLATVHGIVTRSGGSVTVYSEVGRGTSLKVYFPVCDSLELDIVPGPTVIREREGTQTVLLVEDADELRELARRLLERQGYTVLAAANAQDALRIFEQTPAIDVVLTDVVMPGSSGPELIRKLVALQPSLKIIYMSGYAEEAIVRHGILRPGIEFLHKPFSSESLGRKLREVLERQA